MQLANHGTSDSLSYKHGLISIHFLYLISTITFGVFYSSLSLLLTQKFHLPPVTAMGLVGLFFAFHYSLGILGGKIGDKYIDFKVLFICGKFFQLLASLILVLALDNHQLLFFGLGLFLVDSMVSMVSLNMFVTDYFKKTNHQGRLVAFLNTHIWTNMGFVTAFVISGAIYHFYSVEKLLYVTAAFSLVALTCSLFIVPSREPPNQNASSSLVKFQFIKTFLIMLSISLFITLMLTNFHFSRMVVFLVAAVILVVFKLRSSTRIDSNEIAGILTFCMFMVCSVGFWSIYMLGPTFFPLFIEHEVDTGFFGLSIPPQWIQLIGPMTVVLGGNALRTALNYLMEKKQIQLSRTVNFILGLACASLALLVMIYGMSTANNLQLGYSWVISYIFIMAIGEILLAPASKAIVGDLIPKKLQGFCLGISQMSLGISVIISGFISEFYLVQNSNTIANTANTYDTYVNVFSGLILVSLIIILALCFFDRLFKNRGNLQLT